MKKRVSIAALLTVSLLFAGCGGSGLGIHAHRARHEDHEPRGAQDRDGNEALSPVYGLYHAVFAAHRNVCEYHSVKKAEKLI